MTILLVVAVAVVTGWYVRRAVFLLLLPVLAAAVYAVAVGIGDVGRDTPVVALVILAEAGLGAGLLSRRHHLARA